MKTYFCGNVSSVRLVLGFKTAKMNSLSVHGNPCSPLFETWGNALQCRHRITSKVLPILEVYLWHYISKVAYPVIYFDAVYMVNDTWLHSMHPKPSHAVSVLFSSAYFKNNVSIAISVCNLATEWVPMDAIQPSEQPCNLVVVKLGLKSSLIKRRIWRSHAVVPYKQWCGQRPSCVTSTSRLRHFTSLHKYCNITANVAQKNAVTNG